MKILWSALLYRATIISSNYKVRCPPKTSADNNSVNTVTLIIHVQYLPTMGGGRSFIVVGQVWGSEGSVLIAVHGQSSWWKVWTQVDYTFCEI